MSVTKTLIGRWILLLSIVPILVMGISVILLSSNSIMTTKINDTRSHLNGSANELKFAYELKYGQNAEIRIIDDKIFMGGKDITEDYSIVDEFKKYNNSEYTVFYKDTRILTTIVDENKHRIINTTATDIWDNYASNGLEYFDEDVTINNIKYFGYYIPFYNENNEVDGMFFAGIPAKDIYNDIRIIRTVSIVICSILCCAAIIASIVVSSHFAELQNKVLVYLREITNGKYDHKLEKKYTDRNDEYGVIFQGLEKLNSSIRTLILCDTLTELYNRRAAMNYLDTYVANANKLKAEDFTLTICDIDFFKKVNDTYGHNCGDMVLKMVSNVMKEIKEEEGFVSRWGGEEFLVVLKKDKEQALERIKEIADKIRNSEVEYDGKTVKVTMTFGVTDYIAPESIDLTISRADRLLYNGKETGRNKIVS